MGYGIGALWDLWISFIGTIRLIYNHRSNTAMSEQKCLAFYWWYFQTHSGDRQLVYFAPNPTEIHYLGLYSLSGKMSYRKISWSLEAARFGFKLFQSLWNLAGTSAALLPRCLSNFRAIRPLQHPISRLRDFARFGGKTSYRLVNRGPGASNQIARTETANGLWPSVDDDSVHVACNCYYTSLCYNHCNVIKSCCQKIIFMGTKSLMIVLTK